MLRLVRILFVILLAVFTSIQSQRTEAAPFIRVIEEGGIWWFEDARGQRFFSLGVNCIGGCFGHAEESPMEASRKQRIVTHLMDHGFNTAAAWSSPSIWDRFYVADQIYVGFQEGRDDVFDDSVWKERFDPCLRNEVKPFLGRADFIGYFIDNEPWWIPADVFSFYRSLPRESPGSRAFVAFLKSHYEGSIERLNAQWGASYQGFEDIPGSSPAQGYTGAMENGVVKSWRNEVAKTYYGRYVSLLRSLDPDHLILGIRYRGIPDMDLFKTLSPFFDVDSVNAYNRYGNLKPDFEALFKASGKPLMITEYSFSGFPEPGHRSLLFVDVYSQENRGMGYGKYVLEAARAPFMLGMHWFFWMDYPKQDEAEGGFLPDENVGLVTKDESRTYEELSEWIRKTNREVHAAHRNARSAGPAALAPAPAQRKLVPFTPKIDGDLSEWPEETAVKPSEITSLRDDAVLNHTYFLSHDDAALYVAGDVSDSHLENPGGDYFWTGDCIFLHMSPAELDDIHAPGDLSLFLCPLGGGPGQSEPLAVRWRGPGQPIVIPAVVATRVRAGGLGIEARIPWDLLDDLPPRNSCSWRLKIGYQNVNEICQAHWNGIVLFPTR
jgi:hypothetical protein